MSPGPPNRVGLLKRAHAEEEIDWEEATRRLHRFGMLMLAADEHGFDAYLFLDRTLVEEAELETLIQGTCDFLNTIALGSEGGSLIVQWIEYIAEYSFR